MECLRNVFHQILQGNHTLLRIHHRIANMCHCTCKLVVLDCMLRFGIHRP